MTTKTRHAIFQPRALAVAVALGCVAPVQAITFNVGELEAQFDSALSVGASWGVRGADPDFISVASGGKASSRTSDDGRLNFKKGETFSKIFKGIHDLELKYGNTGVFIRGKYWYDFETKDESRLFYDIDDSNRKTAAQSSGAEILDAFLYHNYNLGDLPGSVRVGKQVVSWGESTFIGNSINSINPIDVAAFRRPGAEIKEGLIPVNMLYVSQSLSDTLSMEAFYQLEWDQTVVDNCGTFFSTADVAADGCDDRLVVLGADLPPGESTNSFVDNAYIPRAGDRDARDSGQYGVALRWFAEALNDTEFGLYAMNYHSRNPVFSTVRTTTPNFVTFIPGAPNARYFMEYPEDIRLYGMSFQTNLGGTALSGELSYRPNMPISINSTDLSFAALGLPFNPVFESGHAQNVAGADIHGYERKPFTQAQVTAVQFIDRVLGASRLTLLGEVGYNHISGISDDVSELRFGRDPIYGAGEFSVPGVCGAFNAANPDECQGDGFFTSSSWGYRARASLDYSNVFAGVNLSPSVAWSHDVDGYGPNFNEGSKAVSVGLNADYQNTYNASLSYTDFFGGDYNTITDRDFVALSFGVNF
ncbi:DUF1302 domain-containing protein [Pseudomonas sp. UBA2684]|uniref:DUF1302 domain-containing protein n=1 Tax=Pseudomonas sp. UBA2684 TaxID=1947311 RepID=UPI000E988081|nr:DUF1302 domain-containing protein [Pseudomonas sp. UBA2684]HBX55624.1 DUF1302 domain-containing protein [Pseudomonas sp.]|tara:strand:+ start:828 stop:2594 length:1767 start_codon:yes stop_codon:yes gene_type:complete